jgi:pilus assembly protein CpaB
VSSEHDLGAGAAVSRKMLLLSAGLGVLGALLLGLYLHRFEEQVSGGRRVALLTAIRPIERGALITDDMLGASEVPLAYVEKRAIKLADKGKILGVRAQNELDVHDTLLWSDLAISAETRDLSSLVQPGKRAVTVRASQAGSDTGGNGLLRPGDYVDVFVTFHEDSTSGAGPVAVVLLQRVLVLAVGSETQPQSFVDGKKTAYAPDRERELALSLKVEEAQLLSLARERGDIMVALRSPTDTKVIEAVPDMPIGVLTDKVRREQVQRHRPSHVGSDGPIKLKESTK